MTFDATTAAETQATPMPKTAPDSQAPAPTDSQRAGMVHGSSASDDYQLMFGLSPSETAREELVGLAAAMTESSDDPKLDNARISAGYTYLGQLIAHDLTHMAPQGPPSSGGTVNLRTPELDLDWLYGRGPAGEPHLYEPDGDGKLLVGKAVRSLDGFDRPIAELPNDLARHASGLAKVADIRNDGHLISSQLHLAFAKAHNRLLEEHHLTFDEARRVLVFHYQRTILNEFLPLLADKAVLGEVVKEPFRIFKRGQDGRLPAEFAAAGFRLHSMVRGSYNYNSIFRDARLEQLLGFSGFAHQGQLVPIPSNWVIDWRRFFPLSDDIRPSPSRRIDGKLTKILSLGDPVLPMFEKSVGERTLVRGLELKLPSGQAVAKALGQEPLAGEWIARSGPDGKTAKKLGLHENTPLWYYVMKEAQIQAHGKRLGPVGSRIVAEVLVGLLDGDAKSNLKDEAAEKLRPERLAPGMAGLLRFVDEINPIGTVHS